MNKKVMILSGGVGGAKLALGMHRILPPEELTVVVNTGDDFDHLGLRICPDIDTTLYTLGNIANNELGWKTKLTLDDAMRSAWKWEQIVRRDK